MDIYSHMAIYMFLAEKLTFVYIFKILRREKIQFDVGGSDLSWDGIPIIQQVASGSPTAQTTFNFSVSTATHKTKQTNKTNQQTNKKNKTNKQTDQQTNTKSNKQTFPMSEHLSLFFPCLVLCKARVQTNRQHNQTNNMQLKFAQNMTIYMDWEAYI